MTMYCGTDLFSAAALLAANVTSIVPIAKNNTITINIIHTNNNTYQLLILLLL
jgi:hypothetical protein